MSRKVLIIGYGNPLRGDDGVGQIVAEAVRAHDLADATIIACHQLTPELAEAVAQSEISVFIDAAADIPPGQIIINQLIDETAPTSLGHHLDPGALVLFARRLYGAAPKTFLVKVGAETFEFGEKLSETVQNAVPAVVAAVIRLIRDSDSG
jgi:hydrogenase maturation protease